MRTTPFLASLLLGLFLACSAAVAQPLTTAFTFQGELDSAGAPVTGTYDFRFLLFDTISAGTQIGSAQCADNVAVANGRFTVQLDFGSQFAGQQRFLEVWVRQDTGLSCANATGFTTLAPRQNLTAAPNADFALTAATAATASNATQLNSQPASFYQNAANLSSGTIPSARISGAYSSQLTLSNVANVLAGSGAGLTSLNASSLSSGTLDDNRLSANIPRLNQTNAFTGAANTFLGPVGILRNTPAAGLDLNAAVNFIGLNANGLLYTNTLAGFVGVYESAPNDVTFGSVFGVRSPESVSYGGMWIETLGAGGKPMYGYTNGVSNAWSYLDGSTLDWRLNNNGDRVTVKRNGQVGVGTITPASMFEVQGNNGGFGTNLNNILYTKTSNNAVGIGTSTPGSVFEVQGGIGGLGTNLNNILYTNTFQTAVGIGTSSPVMPLNFASVQGNKLSLWGTNVNAFYGFGIASSLLQMHADTATSDIAFGYGGTAFTENVRFKGDGDVVIGSPPPSPLNKVTVKGFQTWVRDDGSKAIDSFLNTANDPVLTGLDSGNHNQWILAGGLVGRGGGLLTMEDSSSHISAQFGTEGGLGSVICAIYTTAGHGGGLSIDSSNHVVLSADVKNFRIPNPRNPEEDIVYACPEGPEAGAYMRGTGRLSGGAAHIDLPTHFIDVTVSEGMTVQLTPNSPDSLGLAVVNKSNTGFDVVELFRGNGNYDFDWRVECVRKGYETYKPIRSWEEFPAPGKSKEESHTNRMQAIEAARQQPASEQR